ncbi:hypothetical protein L3X38_033036 [Prunus dulcis]|uniref:Uncharacterized protein n=1 Tax=Prunus dulcis TaxID=3755 RepID=A0AAD4YX86_PRUDU|nr:hypothetical protein L3X38_033036 [Prunus dulcis]
MIQNHQTLFGSFVETWRKLTGVNIQNFQAAKYSSSSEVFTLDMLEECHLGASFGQQHYQETAAVTSHNLTKVEESTWVMSCKSLFD